MKTFKIIVLALLACPLPTALWAGDTDVSCVEILKIHDLIQTSTANPVDDALPYSFGIQVNDSSDSLTLITSAAFTPPGGSSTSLPGDGEGNFEFEQTFATQAAMEAVFASGAYGFSLQTATAPTAYNPSLTLSGDNYPSVPKLSNTDWSGGKLILDPSANYTFNWNGPGNFCISLGTEDNEVFEEDLVSSSTVTGGTLLPDQDYIATISFSTHSGFNDGSTNLNPAYNTFTHFTIHTVPAPSSTVPLSAVLLPGPDLGVRLTWTSTSQRIYDIESTTTLAPPWLPIPGSPRTATGSEEFMDFTEAGPSASSRRFFRVRERP